VLTIEGKLVNSKYNKFVSRSVIARFEEKNNEVEDSKNSLSLCYGHVLDNLVEGYFTLLLPETIIFYIDKFHTAEQSKDSWIRICSIVGEPHDP
jgi:hypothetical protein